MKYLVVPVLRILFVILWFRSLDWFFTSNFPRTLPTFITFFALFGLFVAAQVFVGWVTPTVPCPHCGQDNIWDRRICKRCQGSLPPIDISEPEESRIQYWVDVEVREEGGGKAADRL
ncbi:MAG TPA: hypothetical protein VGD69_22420 [Herpetosiphonaceae bacterium]